MKDINADCDYVKVGDSYTCSENTNTDKFFNSESCKKAMHVSTFKGSWKICNNDLKYKKSNGSIFAYPTLMKAGIRIWTYSGDTDAEIPWSSTVDWINLLRSDLGLSDLISYSSWFY